MRTSLVAIATIVAIASSASAQPHPGWARHSNRLARVLVAEADASTRDWTAILWTLEHRRKYLGIPHQRAIAYSATVRMTTRRTQRIHTLALRDMPAGLASQIKLARVHVRRWLAGYVPDQCPRSLHWRGQSDPEPPWFVPLRCGRTRNVFGAAGRKPSRPGILYRGSTRFASAGS